MCRVIYLIFCTIRLAQKYEESKIKKIISETTQWDIDFKARRQKKIPKELNNPSILKDKFNTKSK